jgi:hypothetical protein
MELPYVYRTDDEGNINLVDKYGKGLPSNPNNKLTFSVTASNKVFAWPQVLQASSREAST